MWKFASAIKLIVLNKKISNKIYKNGYLLQINLGFIPGLWSRFSVNFWFYLNLL